jgi:stage II sporulation protein D
MGLSACAKGANPSVPGAPEGDVTSTVMRDQTIRVGLLSFTPQKHLFISISRGSFNCYVGDSLQEFTTGVAGNVLEFTGGDDAIELGSGSESEQSSTSRPEIIPPANADKKNPGNKIIRIESAGGVENGNIEIGPSRGQLRAYRGKIRLILEGKNILAVNEVPLEDYLLGVVPAEMDPTWPVEALKAQAVASRTYALFQLARYGTRGFDVADDERSQRYGGVSVETDTTTRAATQTTNEVVTYEGKLACVVFHKESGGHTASNLDVWPHSGNVPYLVGVSDVLGVMDFSKGGQYKEWSSSATFDQLREVLNRDGETYVGDYFSSISVLGMSETGRLQTLDLQGRKERLVPAMDLAHVLNRNIHEDFLPSNLYKITVENGGYTFTGSGKGHGVGMSQWGAHERALGDQGYKFILTQYFPGTEVTEIPLDGLEAVHNTHIDQIR